MPYARDDAGHIWEVDAQGNPIRLAQAAGQQGPAPVTIGTPRAKAAYDAPQAAANLQRTQQEVQQAQDTASANTRKAKAEAGIAEANLAALNGTGGTALDPKTAAYYAQELLSGGQMPPLGMGKQAASARMQIMQEVANQAGAKGLTGADLARQIAHYKAGSHALSVLEAQHATISASEQTALANGQQLIDRTADLPGQTSYPLVNSAVQAVERQFGNSDISAHDVAWRTFTTEYSKVIAGSPSGAGTLSDSARHEAQETLRSNASPDQKLAAFNQMKVDMANRITAIEAGLNDGYARLTQQPGYSPPATTAGLAVPDSTKKQSAAAFAATMGAPIPGGPGAGSGGGSNGGQGPNSGGPPPSPNAMTANRIVPGAGASAAPYGSTTTSTPIPAAMQAEYQSRLPSVMKDGRFDPNAYARLRNELDEKYGFPVSQGDAYRKFATDTNKALSRGGVAVSDTIPPPEATLTTAQRLANDAVSNPIGAAVATYGNGVAMGIPSLMNRDKMNALRDAHPGASLVGDIVGGTTGAFLGGNALAEGATMVANPVVSALISNPLTADVGYGTISGATQSDNPYKGAIIGALTAGAANRVAGPIAKRFPSMVGLRRPADPLNGGERAVFDATSKTGVDDVTASLARAQEFGVPAALADVSPPVRTLTGSALRNSPEQMGNASDALYDRSLGQYGRFKGAIGRDLGPVDSIPQRSQDLMEQAKTQAGPLYDQAYAAPGATDLDLSDIVSRPSMSRAMANARRIAMEEGRNPDELGFVLNDGGDVTLSNDGRFVDPRGPQPPHESSVISGAGNRAPADLVTFVRQNGGLRDDSGELSAFDATNRGRPYVPFASGDQQAGSLVNPNGKGFDDMAEAAHEAGYFGHPTESPRPTEREFLEALRDTHEGHDRRFSIYDQGTADLYAQAQQNRYDWMNADPGLHDTSEPAGPDRPVMPPDAMGSYQPVAPTWQTLDYVKRGLDDVLEAYRDKTTGKLALDTEGHAINGTRQDFLSRVDQANPAYADARAAYAGPAQAKEALQSGMDAVSMDPDQLALNVKNASAPTMDQMRLGFQSGLNQSAGEVRYSGNPWNKDLFDPNMDQRLAAMYPDNEDGVARLLSQGDLERQMAATRSKLTLNSDTAERTAADQRFQQNSVPGALAQDLMVGAATGPVGAAAHSAVRGGLKTAITNRFAQAAQAKAAALADQIVPLTLNMDPAATAAQVAELQQKDALHQAIVAQLAQQAGVRGGHVGAGASSAVVAGLMH